ncbi:DUF835 domain-containing protein [Pyrococcus sp. ST04]|uniref:DUF835 domain-containing protein n=1 Tax=Pyrococcus sp. ST04 TaxID=1183377 RepID=UPI001ED8F385|nr:DUF835 domain-containing protein [Pyrococcus sp. ST04]
MVRGVEVIAKAFGWQLIPEVIYVTYSFIIFGMIVAITWYVRFLEEEYPFIIKPMERGSPGGNGEKLLGAYIVSGARSRIVDLINMIRELNAPILVFTRSPDFYRGLGENIRTVWITQASEEGIPPTKLHVIQEYAIRFAKENGYAVIIIDCLEYLLIYNEFPSVFKFLVNLKDHLLMLNSALVLAVDEKALEQRQYTLLLNEFEPL